jgi:ribosomal protein S18 acetylase RimI-like enzyme
MIVPKLRDLGIDEYDAIIQLWQQAGLHSMRPLGRDSRDAFAAQLAAGQKVMGLEERGRLIGSVVITHDTRKGWINRLAVHTEHRRRGYGAKLLAAAEKELRAMGIHVFAVLIEADNMTSQDFFSRQGYKAHDTVYMTKRESVDV